jgi:ribosome-associated translation inhibitor RaiA
MALSDEDKKRIEEEESYRAKVRSEHHNAGDIFRAEININVGGRTLRAVSERPDLFSAIDDMKDEINHELASFKGKRFSIVRRSGQKLKEMLRKFYR